MPENSSTLAELQKHVPEAVKFYWNTRSKQLQKQRDAGGSDPKIQILTIEGLLSGKERVEAPPQLNPFAKAQREGKAEKQADLI